MNKVFKATAVQEAIIEAVVSGGNKGYYPQELRLMCGMNVESRKFQAELTSLVKQEIFTRTEIEGGGFEYFATEETVEAYTPAPVVKVATGKKFRLTAEIKKQIAMECKVARTHNPATPLTDLYEAAQRRLLPLEHCKFGVKRSKLEWLVDLMNEITVESPEPLVVEAKPQGPMITLEEEQFAHKVIGALGIEELLKERAAEFVSDVIRKVIVSGAVDELRHSLMGGTAEEYISHRPVHAEQQIVQRKHNPEQRREADKKRLPKVLIVGLLPIQKQEIITSFNKVFDLRFQESNEAITLLEQRAANMDHVLLMAEWIDHAHRYCLKGKKIDFKLVWGTVSNLKIVMSNLAMKELQA